MRGAIRSTLLGALLFLASPLADAGYARGGEASVKATISATGGITFVAKTTEIRVEDDGVEVTFTVPVAALKTGIDMRDSHLRDHLEDAKYPDVRISIVKAEVKLPPQGGSLDGTVGSNVTLHGVKKYEKISYGITAGASGYRVHVDKLVLRLSDYGVDRPSFAGVTVKNEVAVAVDLPLAGG